MLNHDYITSICPDEAAEILSFIAQNNAIYIEKSHFKTHPLLGEIFSEEDSKQGFTAYLLRILKMFLSGNDGTDNGLSALDKEFIYQYYITLNRMNDILTEESEQVVVSQDTLIRLIRQLIAGISIPFVGEPLEGLQIMFFSPCFEIEAYFFQASLYGWAGVLLVSAIYVLATPVVMSVFVALGLKGIQHYNFHFLEHNEKQIVGVILILLAVLSYFVQF